MNTNDTIVMAQMAVVIVGTLAALTVLGIAVHAYLRRARRHVAATLSPPSDERMQRLEQAVDAIAVEVERISEGQRFLTRLQTEQKSRELSS